ncbi:MAG TPA: hypothetical protein PKE26_02530 [Kiritimatiellia bacterium]|nr:hypothetical protein [Kiritimatiellia bacterium]HMO97964.1 hypothetical protein [Kiritimatiellia bacterium]HMP95315.1 hypothetical protein [Kiritimatiellia bacterium]
MIARTTREILDQARYFHRQLHAFYEALKEKIEQPKLHMILDYLGQHEQRMETALKRYEEDISRKMADTWFKFTPAQTVDEALREITVAPDASLDDLMAIAIRLENYFVALYRSAADQAVSAEVKEVFDQLLKETIRERLKLTRDLVDMHDFM